MKRTMSLLKLCFIPIVLISRYANFGILQLGPSFMQVQQFLCLLFWPFLSLFLLSYQGMEDGRTVYNS